MSKPDKVHLDKPAPPTFDAIIDKEKETGENASVASSTNDPNQKPWILISTLLVLSAFLQSVKPSDPYIPEFMQVVKGYSQEAVNRGPQFRTYFMTISLPIVSYAAEYLTGYISPIVFGLLCRLTSQFTFYYGTNLFWLYLSYSVFGLSHSTKVIYSAFTYSLVPVHVFHRITAYIRGANLLAHVAGSTLGQLLLHPKVMAFLALFTSTPPYTNQFFVSQLCVGVGVILFLTAIYLNWRNHSGNEAALANIKPPPIHSLQDVGNLFKTVYATNDLRIWSIWFVLSFACVDAVWDYQGLLFTASDKLPVDYTGYITAATRLACALAAMIAGRTRSIFAKFDVSIIILCGGAISCLLFMSSLFRNLYMVYILYVSTMLLNEYCMCAATAQIAVRTDQSIRGIILLINTFAAMVLQTTLQVTFTQMGLDIRGKYAGLAICLFVGTGIILVVRLWRAISAAVSRFQGLPEGQAA